MKNGLLAFSLYLLLSGLGGKSNEVKFTPEGNPVVLNKFTADPAPMVHNGTLYLYVGMMKRKKGRTLT